MPLPCLIQFSLRRIACIVLSIISLNSLFLGTTFRGDCRLLAGRCRFFGSSEAGMASLPVHLGADCRAGVRIEIAQTVGSVKRTL